MHNSILMFGMLAILVTSIMMIVLTEKYGTLLNDSKVELSGSDSRLHGSYAIALIVMNSVSALFVLFYAIYTSNNLYNGDKSYLWKYTLPILIFITTIILNL